MSEPNEPLKITGWNLQITWSDGKSETIINLPNDLSQGLDDYFSDLETELAHDHAMKHSDTYVNKRDV